MPPAAGGQSIPSLQLDAKRHRRTRGAVAPEGAQDGRRQRP